MTNCQGCDTQGFFDVCMDCVKARARAAMTSKCACPKTKKRPVEKRMASRRWLSCTRCLGSIKQLS